MTEVEWLTAETPDGMLEWLEPIVVERKLRLFVLACLRYGQELYAEPWQAYYLDLAERYAEGEVDEPTRAVAESEASELEFYRAIPNGPDDDSPEPPDGLALALGKPIVTGQVSECSERLALAMAASADGGFDGFEREVLAEHAAFVRDIFGNPFRDPPIDPRWRTATVVAIAQAIYAERDFAALPVLADALEEAGCDAWDVLAHARGGGPHVRGCWLLDKLLGKE